MGKSKWLCVLLGATLLGISPVFADDVVTDSDNYAKAISYNDVYATLGPIPKPSKELKLGYAAKAFENEFWRSVKEGAEAQSGEFKKQGMAIAVEVKAAQGEADEQGQLAIMNDMVNKKFDAIIASPISDGNLIPAIEKAQKAGIPLVNSIGGFVKEIPVYVGPRHFTSGQLAAEWVAAEDRQRGGRGGGGCWHADGVGSAFADGGIQSLV